MSHRRNTKRQVLNVSVVVLALVLIGIILWIDITTGLWGDLVILGGLAAGLVTFLLTGLVFERVIARATERKWAPVTRLALSEFLHSLADEKHSEVSRGHVVTRSLTPVDSIEDPAALHAALHALRHQVLHERRQLAETLGRWAEFLATSGSNTQIMKHVAALSLQLDIVRDRSVELEASPSEVTLNALNTETKRCNQLISELEAELRAQIDREDQLAISKI